jgi:hypothetical protein
LGAQVNTCMWILHFLPDSLINLIAWLILLAGVAGFVASKAVRWLPMLGQYKLPLELGGVVVIAMGSYLMGGVSNEQTWRARVAEVEQRMAKAEAQAAKENVRIIEKVVVKTEQVRERGQDIVKYIDREVVKYDAQCKIPKEFVDAINRAAEPPK